MTQEQFPATDSAAPVQSCPDEGCRLHLVPRKAANIFDAEKRVKRLLPERYPNRERRIKDIESNFYPDLAVERTVTAILTNDGWDLSRDPRPAPVPNVPVYFQLGTNTAGATLSATQATTDAEGRASIQVRLQAATLRTDPQDLRQNNVIEIRASREPNGAGELARLFLRVHRNEDFETAVGPGETPDEFSTTLRPVIEGRTWLVRQTARPLVSDGVRAVQQLLNQVSCRKLGAAHHFLAVNGRYEAAMVTEARQFLADFGAAASGGAEASYRAARFHVRVEEEVQRYVLDEYGVTWQPGILVDWHMLVGTEEWQRGPQAQVMQADGLLDIYRAVVWVFIEQMVERGTTFADLAIRWMRHPNDSGPNSPPNDRAWPADVSRGVAYAYGGGASRDEFTAALNANNPPPATIRNWSDYQGGPARPPGTGNRIGIHKGEYDPNPGELRHYIGIDCSAFVQRSTMECVFRADHCSDLVDVRVSQEVPTIGARDGGGTWPRRLATGSWPTHFRAIDRAFRHQVVFRGDALNVSGSHIVMLTMNSRTTILDNRNLDNSVDQILQASGTTEWNRGTRRAPQISIDAGHVRKTECTRRVIASPLAYWTTFHNDWTGTTNNANCVYGRIYLWP